MRRPNISDLVDSPAELGAAYRIFIRDLELTWAQDGADLLASIDLVVDRPHPLDADRYRNVVCYDTVVKAAKALAADPQTSELPLLVDGIAAKCLEDPRVRSAVVRVRPRNGAKAGDAGIEALHRRAGSGRPAQRLTVVGAH